MILTRKFYYEAISSLHLLKYQQRQRQTIFINKIQKRTFMIGGLNQQQQYIYRNNINVNNNNNVNKVNNNNNNNNNNNYNYHYKKNDYSNSTKKTEETVADHAHGNPYGDMAITFLGTGSCTPSIRRNVSSLIFRKKSKLWLFDCGEATQLQLQSTSIKMVKVEKIFITHLHGDHIFGLPGVLCMITRARETYEFKNDLPILEIYGPQGLRCYLRTALRYSNVKVCPYRVIELKNVPMLARDRFYKDHQETNLKKHSLYGEVGATKEKESGGKGGGLDRKKKQGSDINIYPNSSSYIYDVYQDKDIVVQAAPLRHTIPCVGYTITEGNHKGRLNAEKLLPLMERNKFEIMKKKRYKNGQYMKLMGDLKKLKDGESFEFPVCHTIVQKEDIMSPERPGRKIVILGDTSNSDLMVPIAQNCDILIHEATNTLLQDEQYNNNRLSSSSSSSSSLSPYDVMEEECKSHGHSTPRMAGKFAKRINAKALIMNHFSQRYSSERTGISMQIMKEIEAQARKASGILDKKKVIAAWDFLQINIPVPSSQSSSLIETTFILQNENKENEEENENEENENEEENENIFVKDDEDEQLDHKSKIAA